MDNKEILNISVITPPLDIVKDFNTHLEESKKVTTYNTNCFNGAWRSSFLPASDDRTVYFYEFSNVSSTPKKFLKVSEFLAWAKTVNIFISSYTENELKTHAINYATCYTGSATLMVRHSYNELQVAHERYSRNSNSYVNGSRSCYDDDYYGYGGYSDWD